MKAPLAPPPHNNFLTEMVKCKGETLVCPFICAFYSPTLEKKVANPKLVNRGHLYNKLRFET